MPCEKYIESKDGMGTVVGILDSITVNGSEFEENSAVPFQWAAVSLWMKGDDSDVNKEFEQKVELFRPDEKMVFGAGSTFKTSDKHLNYRVVYRVAAFPIGVEGVHWLRLSVRPVGDENEWAQMANFPVKVIYQREFTNEDQIEVEINPQTA